MRAAAVWPGLRFISRAEREVIMDVICWPPIEIIISAIRPLMRTASILPMMSSGRLDATNLLLVNPLFDGGETDPQLQSRIAELQQFVILPPGFACSRHRNAILQSASGAVNTVDRRKWICHPASNLPYLDKYRQKVGMHVRTSCIGSGEKNNRPRLGR
jgi:hypothetical protein